MTSYFLCFFYFALEKIAGPKLFWPIVYRLNDFNFCRFKGNTIETLSSAFFKLVVCLPIGYLNFFRYEKLFEKFYFFFSIFSTAFKKVYQLKDRLFPIVPAYFPRFSFYLTPLSSAFEKVCGRICDPYFFFVFSKTTCLKSEFLVSMNRKV